jgi:hypothetical protein
MIHKTWPDNVFLRQEGKCWHICRLERFRGKDVADVLDTGFSREAVEAELLQRG